MAFSFFQHDLKIDNDYTPSTTTDTLRLVVPSAYQKIPHYCDRSQRRHILLKDAGDPKPSSQAAAGNDVRLDRVQGPGITEDIPHINV